MRQHLVEPAVAKLSTLLYFRSQSDASQFRILTGMGVFNNFADVFIKPCPNFNGPN